MTLIELFSKYFPLVRLPKILDSELLVRLHNLAMPTVGGVCLIVSLVAIFIHVLTKQDNTALFIDIISVLAGVLTIVLGVYGALFSIVVFVVLFKLYVNGRI